MSDKKIVIVTGATAGLGYQCALHIATNHSNTHRVIVASRSLTGVQDAVEKIREHLSADSQNAVLACEVPLDLSSLESVKQFSEWASQRYPVIDSLVLNAGLISVKFGLSRDGFENTFAVNHLGKFSLCLPLFIDLTNYETGHFYLTRLLMPNILRSSHPRVVVVSSGVHDPVTKSGFNAPPWSNESPADWAYGSPATNNSTLAYPFSKLCNVLFAYELRERIKDPRLAILVLDPGFCPSTGFTRDFNRIAAAVFETFMKADYMIREATGINKIKQLSSAERSGNIMAALAVDEKWVGGSGVTPARYFAIEVERESSVDSYNKEYQKALWEFSEKVVVEKMGKIELS
ncbi:hypothetical protein BJ742DRAFT_873550 [Cladochytrium replicatum]|nr:hypothetical protein BJ742DRAFT_873550 [Cladochytrium replicatum]